MTALPRRADGALDLPGLHVHELEYDFGWATAIPTDLTNTGTAAITGTNGVGALNLTTAATDAAQSAVLLSKLVDLTAVDAVQFSILGLKQPAAGYPTQIFFSLEGGSTGGAVWRKVEQQLRSRASTSQSQVAAKITTHFAGRAVSTNLSLLILPKLKIVALLTGDQEVQAVTMPDLVLNTVQPKFIIQTAGAVSSSVTIGKIRLTVRTS